jgi:hypothetical protein
MTGSCWAIFCPRIRWPIHYRPSSPIITRWGEGGSIFVIIILDCSGTPSHAAPLSALLLGRTGGSIKHTESVNKSGRKQARGNCRVEEWTQSASSPTGLFRSCPILQPGGGGGTLLALSYYIKGQGKLMAMSYTTAGGGPHCCWHCWPCLTQYQGAVPHCWPCLILHHEEGHTSGPTLYYTGGRGTLMSLSYTMAVGGPSCWP